MVEPVSAVPVPAASRGSKDALSEGFEMSLAVALSKHGDAHSEGRLPSGQSTKSTAPETLVSQTAQSSDTGGSDTGDFGTLNYVGVSADLSVPSSSSLGRPELLPPPADQPPVIGEVLAETASRPLSDASLSLPEKSGGRLTADVLPAASASAPPATPSHGGARAEDPQDLGSEVRADLSILTTAVQAPIPPGGHAAVERGLASDPGLRTPSSSAAALPGGSSTAGTVYTAGVFAVDAPSQDVIAGVATTQTTDQSTSFRAIDPGMPNRADNLPQTLPRTSPQSSPYGARQDAGAGSVAYSVTAGTVPDKSAAPELAITYQDNYARAATELEEPTVPGARQFSDLPGIAGSGLTAAQLLTSRAPVVPVVPVASFPALVTQLAQSTGQVRLALAPEGLGSVVVQVSATSQGVTVVVNASDEALSAIGRQAVLDALTQAGFLFARVEFVPMTSVSASATGQDSFGSQAESQREQAQGNRGAEDQLRDSRDEQAPTFSIPDLDSHSDLEEQT